MGYEADLHSLYRYVRNSPLIRLDPEGSWDQYIHHDVTYELASEYFIPAAARTIAHACDLVDRHRDTEPVAGDWTYHFDQPAPPRNELRPFYQDARGKRYLENRFESVQAVYSTQCQEAFRLLGKGLHPLQDYYGFFRKVSG